MDSSSIYLIQIGCAKLDYSKFLSHTWQRSNSHIQAAAIRDEYAADPSAKNTPTEWFALTAPITIPTISPRSDCSRRSESSFTTVSCIPGMWIVFSPIGTTLSSLLITSSDHRGVHYPMAL